MSEWRSILYQACKFFATTIVLLMAGRTAYAQVSSDAEIQRKLEQQIEQSQAPATTGMDVFTPLPEEKKEDSELRVIPEESPCFEIQSVEWRGDPLLIWMDDIVRPILKQCVGATRLRDLQDRLGRELLRRGFVTSRLLIPEQNISTGVLMIHFVSGRISAIRNQGTPAGAWQMVFPKGTGGLLNQRDMDQALENIRRLPSQLNTAFDLIPGARLGETDIVIKHPEQRRYRGRLTLDDSGGKSTGKYQVGGLFTIDSPFYLYDALSITYNSNADFQNNSRGSRTSSVNWNVPFGYGSFSVGANQSRYQQTVAGFMGDIVFSGRSQSLEIGLGVVPYRTSTLKGTALFNLTRNSRHSYLNDAEIGVQHQDVVGYKASYNHRQYLDQTTMDVGMNIVASLPHYSNAPGLIAGVPDWDGRFQTLNLQAGLVVPFTLENVNLRYQINGRFQNAQTSLPSSEYFSIGNRYTVRGFDGQVTLAAEEGWLIRNDLIWPIGQGNIFFGLDIGRVDGPNAQTLMGRTLSGTILGFRGTIKTVSYEGTIGWPLHRPDGFETAQPALTVSLVIEL